MQRRATRLSSTLRLRPEGSSSKSSAAAKLWSVLFAILAGCVNQHKEVQTYRDVVDAGLSRPASYQSGQTLSLDRAMALANQDNEQIALQGENYLQALIAKNRAFAAFLPTVSFQPSFTIEQRPAIASAFGPITPAVISADALSSGFVANGNTWHSFQAPVVGSMELNLSSLPNLHSAEQTVEQQRQLLLDAQATVLLNVAETYYQVLRSEQQVVVLSNSLAVDAERLRQVEGRFQNHLALALEVSQTRAQAAATQVSLTQARNDVRDGRRTLAYLLGVPAVDGSLVDDVTVPQTLLPVDAFRQLAASTRPDLLAAQAQVRAAKYAVDAAISEYYPTVTLNVAGFLYREYFSQASKWDAILQANLPIFSAGIIEADVRAAWSKLRQAALYESELRRQIDQDVQTAYDNLVTSGRQLGNLHAEVQAADDARVQAGQLLDNGLAVPLDVLTAQDTLLNAQLNYTSESFDRTVFYLDLLRIVGQLTPLAPRQWQATTRPATQPD
jgi:outer membrane protein TolC